MRSLLTLLSNLLVNGRRLLGRCWRALVRRRPPDYVRLRLQGAVPPRPVERQVPRLLRRFFPAPRRLSFEALDRCLERIARDPRTRGVVLSLGALRLGWGQVTALRERLAAFREAGKDLVVHLEEGGNREYYLASVGRLVVVPPGGHVWLTGLAIQVLFYRELLDRLTAEPEALTAGRYKNALDPFVRREMSPEHREALEAIADEVSRALVDGVATGRGLAPDRVRELVDAGPYPPAEAREAGLVDHVAYEDELETLLGEDGRKVEIASFGAFERRAGRPLRWLPVFRRRRIGFVDLRGVIQTGRSARSPLGGPTAGHETVCEALEEARESRDVRAVVLYIDSRGGSGLASDRIWHEVRRLREKKPVVACLGDVAASGGYFVACAADHVVAASTTLTGSIGVLSGKLNLSGLLHRVGIRAETVKRGASADLQSASRRYTSEERARLQRHLESFYDDFVDKVARSRKLAPEAVRRVAEGRVWTGLRALEHGLIDELGTLATAVARARERAGLRPGDRAPLLDLGPSTPLFQLPLDGGLLDALGEHAATLLALAGAAGDPALCLLPFDLRID